VSRRAVDGLKGYQMSTSIPSAPNERRIIPLRTTITSDPAARGGEASSATEPGEVPHAEEDIARHYLKFMLPSIPVAAFILTFVVCEVLLGLQSTALATAAHVVAPPEDPSLPLAAAVVMSTTTGALCMWIYFGYLRISRRDNLHHVS